MVQRISLFNKVKNRINIFTTMCTATNGKNPDEERVFQTLKVRISVLQKTKNSASRKIPNTVLTSSPELLSDNHCGELGGCPERLACTCRLSR